MSLDFLPRYNYWCVNKATTYHVNFVLTLAEKTQLKHKLSHFIITFESALPDESECLHETCLLTTGLNSLQASQ